MFKFDRLCLWTRGPARTMAGVLAVGCAAVALAGLGAGTASAQEALPNDYVAPPAGTNLVAAYYLYGHDTSYNVAKGSTIKDSGIETNLGIVRYVHVFDMFGILAGWQVFQVFGNESGGHIDGESLGSTTGAANPALSFVFWPYHNAEKKMNLVVTSYLYPPIGSYNKNEALNLAGAASGTNGWGGDLGMGWDQGIGDHFSYDIGFDARIFGDSTSPFGRVTSQDSDYRVQVFLNWAWTRQFQTSIGYEGVFGGNQYINGIFDGATSEEQRGRFVNTYYITPADQLIGEIHHDFTRVGGFSEQFGLQIRYTHVF